MDRLTTLDALFLNYEQHHAPMHVAGLYLFSSRPEIAGRPGVHGIFQAISERIHLVPRYRQRVMWVPFHLAEPVWVDDPDFDLSYHLRRSALPRPGGMKELLEFVARIHARPLDRKRPLWEMYIIEGLRGGKIALYSKTHHAMVDGISAVDLATILLDFEPEGKQLESPPPYQPPPLPSSLQLLREVGNQAAERSARMLRLATRSPRELARDAAEVAESIAAATGLRGLLNPAPRSPINVKVGAARRIALVDIPLSRAKTIKNALGGTVNDVVLTVVGEALHEFLKHRRDTTGGLSYRIMVPVSVRDESERMAFGNRVAGMFIDIPVGPMAARRRYFKVSGAMADLKEKRQAVAADRLVAISSWAPAALHGLAGRIGYVDQRVINLVVSNVPGVQVPMYACGARLLEAYPLLPLGANLALVICVTSYDGGMYFGMVGDRDAIPDVNVIGRGLEHGFARLEEEAGIRKLRTARRPATGAHVT